MSTVSMDYLMKLTSLEFGLHGFEDGDEFRNPDTDRPVLLVPASVFRDRVYRIGTGSKPSHAYAEPEEPGERAARPEETTVFITDSVGALKLLTHRDFPLYYLHLYMDGEADGEKMITEITFDIFVRNAKREVSQRSESLRVIRRGYCLIVSAGRVLMPQEWEVRLH